LPSDRSKSSEEFKMVLAVRGELRLTPGKAAVQVAHAAVLLVELATRRKPEWVERWRAAGQKKIAVVAPTLDDLLALQRRATQEGIPSVLVEDAGFTEVAPGTKTCLGLGPAPARAIDPLTGTLGLL
jgi:peptidyl-tRNA hydrolase, PTH2 family